MTAAKKTFHMTVKPIGALCNMTCSYCYYLHKKDMLSSASKMDDATLEQFIQAYIESQSDSDTIFFTWQGGEPTLLGVDYFKKVVELQQKYCPAGKKIENDFQTNGFLIDPVWCVFLKQNNFIVGLSVDGPDSLNFCRSMTTGEQMPVSKVIEAAELLRSYHIPFSTLTSVHYENAKKPLEVYRFLRDTIGSTYMQFNPIVEPKNFRTVPPLMWDQDELPTDGTSAARPRTPDSYVEDFSVDPRDYGNFLCDIFDEWYAQDQGKIFVYLFENFISLWMGGAPLSCLFGKECGHSMTIDRDGSIYACDHFVYPPYSYGKLSETTFDAILSSAKYNSFSRLKSSLPQQCKDCRFLTKCYGECPRRRFLKTKDDQPGLNYLCSSYLKFFNHIDELMDTLAEKYKP